MKTAPTIVLSIDERKTLTTWSRGRSTPARLVLRAKIVLAAADGKTNEAIADELHTSRSPLLKRTTPTCRQPMARCLDLAEMQRRLPIPTGQYELENVVLCPEKNLFQLLLNLLRNAFYGKSSTA